MSYCDLRIMSRGKTSPSSLRNSTAEHASAEERALRFLNDLLIDR
jgi:hypothetical protein